MADLPGGSGDNPQRRPPTPGWVKVLGIIGVVVILLVLVLLVLGGGPGSHGPGRHSAAEGSDAPDASSRWAVQEGAGPLTAAIHELAANADEVFFPDRLVVTGERPVTTALTSTAARRAVTVRDEVDSHLAPPWSGRS